MTDDDSNLPANFPAAGPGGEIVPYLSPKQRASLLDWVYREIGGGERMAKWAGTDNDTLAQFYRLWAKGAARPMANDVEEKNNNNIEKLLARLDAGEGATVINGTATEVDDD